MENCYPSFIRTCSNKFIKRSKQIIAFLGVFTLFLLLKPITIQAAEIPDVRIEDFNAMVAPGCMTIVGDLTVSATGSVDIEINGVTTVCTDYSQVIVTTGNTITLDAGASFNLTGTNTTGVSTALVFIDNQGSSPISGTFAGLPEGGTVTLNSVVYVVSYVGGDGNDFTACPDVINPTITCQNINVSLDINGLAVVTATSLNVAVSDNCSPVDSIVVVVDPDTVYCDAAGTDVTVIITATDMAGNSSICSSLVGVQDNIPPGDASPTCNDIDVYLDATGAYTLSTADSAALVLGTVDNCDVYEAVFSQSTYDCTDLGAVDVTIDYEDDHTNTSACVSVVTVKDTISPVAACVTGYVLYLDASGMATLVADSLDDGSSDACGIETFTVDVSAFDCSHLGAQDVILTVTDTSGNSTTCMTSITVSDTISPVATCKAYTLYLDASGAATLVADSLNDGSTDACGIETFAVDISSFDCTDLGANTVVLTVTDTSGNVSTCTATVTVADTISPTATCQDITLHLDANGMATVVADSLNNGSTDACGIETLAVDISSVGCTDVGTPVIVTLTVTDTTGNSSTCTSAVTVLDTISPTLTCPTDSFTAENDEDECAYTVVGTEFDVTGADNCLSTATITHDYIGDGRRAHNTTLDGVEFEVGTHTVTWTITSSGQTATCETTIVILDTQEPDASCPIILAQGITVNTDGDGNDLDCIYEHAGTTWDITFFENCDIDSIFYVIEWEDALVPDTLIAADPTLTSLDGYSFQIGETTVTAYVTDLSGNFDECFFEVTVEDEVEPDITACALAQTVYTDSVATCMVTIPDLTDEITVTDNCSHVDSLTITQLPVAGAYAPTIAHGDMLDVTIYVVDEAGNETDCIVTLTVADTIAPTGATTAGITGVDTCMNAVDDVYDFDATAAAMGYIDNCSATVTAIATDSAVTGTDCDWTLTYTFTVNDAYGNGLSDQTYTVTGSDQTAPTGTAPTAITGENTCKSAVDASYDFDAVTAAQGYSDNCSQTVRRDVVQINISDVTAIATDSVVTGTDCAWTLTYTFTVNDACGNGLSDQTYTISGSDQTAPTGATTAGITDVDTCISAVNDSYDFDAMAAAMGYTDNCSATVTAIAIDSIVTGTNCDWTLTYTFNVNDSCGNSLTGQTYTVTGSDQTAPTGTPPTAITGVDTCMSAVDATYDFNAGAAAYGYSDNCSSGNKRDVQIATNILAIATDSVVTGTDCAWTLTYTFTVNDACGNGLSDQTYTISGSDQMAPTGATTAGLMGIDACITASGDFDASAAAMGYTDNCSAAVTAILTDSVMVGNNCGWTLTYTFTVSDSCGNGLTGQTYTVTGSDQTAPVAMTNDTTLYLDATGMAVLSAAGIDDGSYDGCSMVALSLDTTSFDCSYVDATWPVTLTVTDSCGLVSTKMAMVTILDTIKPLIANCPATDLTFNSLPDDCKRLVQLNPPPMGSDNCDSIRRSISFNPTVQVAVIDTTTAGAHLFEFNEGTTEVTYEFTDGSGNISSCVFNVIVQDVTPPILLGCAQSVVLDNDLGECSAEHTFMTPGVIEACGVSSLQVTYHPGTPAPISLPTDIANVSPVSNVTATFLSGQTIVRFIATDVNGMVDSCEFTVMVNDTEDPIAMCQDVTVYLDDNGMASIDSNSLDAGSSDNCMVDYFVNDINDFDCADLFVANPVTMTVYDTAGMSASCNANVTVLDTVSPMAVCQDVTVYLDASGAASITADDVNNASTDNCTDANNLVLAINTSTFNCDDVIIATPPSRSGTSSRMMSGDLVITGAYDAGLTGGTPKGVELYVINDIPDLSIYGIGSANNGGGTDGEEFSFPADAYSAGDFIYVSSESVQFTNWFGFAPTYSDGSMGINGDDAVELFMNGTVIDVFGDINTDGSGQPWDFLDGWAYRTSDTGPDGTSFTLGSWTFSGINVFDNQTTNAGSPSPFPYGTYSVTSATPSSGTEVILTVTDESGNSSTCTATVTVLDTISPVADCVDIDLYLDANGEASITAADVNGSSVEACGLETISIDVEDFDCTMIGSNDVVLTLIDSSGNTGTCTADVNVIDTISPIAMCNNLDVYLDATGVASIMTSMVDNGSDDNCAIDTTYISVEDFTCDNVGLNSVVLTVVDVSGNMSTCTADVTVYDTVAPVVTCADVDVYLDATGLASILLSDIAPSATDACGVETLTAAQLDFACSDEGMNMIEVIAVDSNGNADTCTAIVTVIDTVAPVASCNSLTVYLDANGMASVTTMDIDNGSSDACGIETMTLDVSDFDCSNVGDNDVVLTVVDSNANSATCMATVTVIDTMSPMALCRMATLYLDDNGMATLAVDSVNDGSSDNCAIDTMYIDVADYDCSQVGTQNVTLTVVDVNGLVSTCTTTVDVLDTISPVVACASPNVYLDDQGQGSLVLEDLYTSITDACGIETITGSQFNFDCSNVGVVMVDVIAVDSNGNTSMCQAAVNVLDTIPPTVSCADITVTLDANGKAYIQAFDLIDFNMLPGDQCGNTGFNISLDSFDCADVGQVNVTLYVDDLNGNVDSCIAIVTVVDNIAPVVVCNDTTIYVDANGMATVTVDMLHASSSDVCGIDTMYISQSAFDCSETGSNQVTVTVIDSSGNMGTCTATVMVLDTTAPTADCQTTTVYLDANGMATLVADSLNANSTDNCVTLTYGASQSTFSCDEVGANSVDLYVTDANGNSDTCSTTVMVVDTVAPMAVCANIDVYLDMNGMATIVAMDIDNGSSDACGIDTMMIDVDMFTCNELGLNDVTLTVIDSNGLAATCMAQVNVLDTVAPVAVCMDIDLYIDNNGIAVLDPLMINGASTDACGVDSIYVDIDTFTCSEVGMNTVVLTVLDASGNAGTCMATVTVIDTIAPMVTCANTTVYLDANGLGSVVLDDLYAGSLDSCGVESVTASQMDFSCADIGTVFVDVIAIDSNGNADTCQAEVTVLDTVAALVICKDFDLYLDANGMATLVADSLDDGSSDACGIDTITVDVNSFDCSTLGMNTVTLYVTDVNGNVDSCTSTVMVIDTIAPDVVCATIDVYLDGNNMASITAADVDGGTTDACGVESISVSTMNFDCSNTGENMVEFIAVDSSGNADTCIAIVNVLDTVPPTVACQDVTITLDANGIAVLSVVSVLDFSNFPSDNCGQTGFDLSQDTFTCADTGDNMILLIVDDLNGNQDTCMTLVTVVDGMNPYVECKNDTVYLDGNGMVSIDVMNVLDSAYDVCGIDTMMIDSTDFDCSEAGDNTVTLTVVDNNGNSSVCTSTVTVLDTIMPVALCSPIDVYLDANGMAIITPSMVDAGSTDNCSQVNLSLSVDTFNCANVGLTTTMLTVTDNSGNENTCVSMVTVIDTIAPIASCSAITVYLDDLGSVDITAVDLDNSSTDACGIDTLMIDITSFDCSNIGDNDVELTVIDVNGNESTCIGVVTVVDTINPTFLTCPTDQTYSNTPNNCSSFILFDTAAVNDACGIATQSVKAVYENNAELTIQTIGSQNAAAFPVGVTTITYYATDVNGNVDSCVFTITIVDNQDPIILDCPDDIVLNSDANQCGTVATWSDPSPSDNCPGASLTQSQGPLSGTLFEVGVTTVEYMAVDASGNETTCSFTVTVLDVTAPVVTCTDVIAYLDANGVVTVDSMSLVASVVENCGSYELTFSNLDFDCDSIGTHDVIVSALDTSGNMGTCTSVVTIMDTITPILVLNDVTVTLDNNGMAFVDESMLVASSSDNCMIDTITLDVVTFNCDDSGDNIVTVTATDVNGNETVGTAIVTVEGSISSNVVYVDLNATGTATGLNWTDAFINLDDIMNSCITDIDTIFVAEGTYSPSTNDRDMGYTFTGDIVVLGGYSNMGMDRDTTGETTILCGDIGTIGVNTDNTHHTVVIDENATNVIIDGFTISCGYADGFGDYRDQGAGVLSLGTGTLTHVIITDNFSIGQGSALLSAGSSHLTIGNALIKSDNVSIQGTLFGNDLGAELLINPQSCIIE